MRLNFVKPIVFVAAALGAVGAEARVKFVATGWDAGDMQPKVVAANAEALARTGIDGLTLVLPPRTQADGSKAEALSLSEKVEIKYETYADVVPHWREIVRHDALKDSFLICGIWAFRSAWTNDANWRVMAGNMRVLARLAKEGGLKGVFFDNEDYCKARLFMHRPEECDYRTACKLARQRGREVFAGVFEEFPDIVFLPYWLLSQNKGYASCSNPVEAMEREGNLWPAFVNGILDVIPPQAKLVDGDEFAYSYDYADGGYARAAARQLVGLLPLVATTNRVKYRSQLSIGFGVYLDAYVSTNRTAFYRGPVNGSRLEHLRLNLKDAVANADEYVWLYGERFSWVKWQNAERGWLTLKYSRDRTWEEALPGLGAVLREIKNPAASLTERVLAARAKGAKANRFPEALARERHWSRGNRGTYTVEPKGGIGGALKATGVQGCYELPVKVNPGETWVIDMYQEGSAGAGNLPSMCYQDAKGWHWELGTVYCEWQGADTVGRRRISGLVRIPEKMTTLVLMLNCGQRPDESVTFTDIMMAMCED